MKIAIVGGGISGLGAAYALKDVHDVTLYEKDTRLGGHANTVDIDYDGAAMQVDTGFIVYNTRNYPNLVAMLAALDVAGVQTDMAFAFCDGRLEWSSNFPRGVFAQKRNIFSPRFLAMLNNIRRFNALAPKDLASGRLADMTLGGYLRLRGFSEGFAARYLRPMGAAIWSTTEGRILEFPAESFLRFFANHSLLQMVQPTWRTVAGGSRTYVDKIAESLGPRVRTGAAVVEVVRKAGKVAVREAGGDVAHYDHVVLAGHSDENLAMLADADRQERDFLSAIRYAPNRAWLHRDRRLMPSRSAAWGSWNYISDSEKESCGYVSYWMNSLQDLDRSRPLFVSLNPETQPDPALTFGSYDYHHPQFDTAALAAQRQFARIQGQGGVWHAGAWLGYGFHEDGLVAGLRVALALGGKVGWDFVDHRIPGGPLAAPARPAERTSRRAKA